MGSVVVSAAWKRDLSCGKTFYHSREVLCPRSSFRFPPFPFYLYFRYVSSLPFSFIIYQFLLLLGRSLYFLQFNTGSLSVFSVLLMYLSSHPSSRCLVPKYYILRLNFIVTCLFFFLVFWSPSTLSFSFSFSPHYYVPLVSRLCTW